MFHIEQSYQEKKISIRSPSNRQVEAITISNIFLLDYNNSFRKILPLYSDKKGGESMSDVKLKGL